jgi:hypothetical protein
MSRGWRYKHDIQMNIMAWHAANVMNVHTKKQVTVDKLLGKKKEMTPFDRESEVSKLRIALTERRERNGSK